MPRRPNDLPTYRQHKPTNQAVCTVRLANGQRKDLYLGAWNSAVSREAKLGIGMEGRAGIGVCSLGPAHPEEAGGRKLLAHESMMLRAGMLLASFEAMPEPKFPDKADEFG